MKRAGSFRPGAPAWLAAHLYAHRGLHRPEGPAENSLPAFAAAIAAGYGAECDVRLSADAIAHVFHDARLDRMVDNATGPLAARTAAELAACALRQGSGPVPRLAALLALIAGRAPLLIELKIDHWREIHPLCKAVLHDLRHYDGPAAVMSFHPGVSRWFHHFGRAIPHGLVMTEENRKGARGRAMRHLAIGCARPDFLAYDIRDLPSPLVQSLRAKGMPVLSWTVRDASQWQTVAAEADAPIFEGSVPTEARR